MKKLKKEVKGITMVALVVTIIVLLILSAVAINLGIGNNGLFTRGKQATEEHIKQEAKEAMNMKISGIQIESYGETQKLPTLQYLADKLCEDEEMEYVLLESKKEASLEKIDIGKANSIFTKIKKYPYEFEIDSELKLASIDGIKLATNNETITITRAELNDLIKQEVSSQLKDAVKQEVSSQLNDTVKQEVASQLNTKIQYYNKNSSNVKVAKRTAVELVSMTIPAGKYAITGGFYSTDANWRYGLVIYYNDNDTSQIMSSAYDNAGDVATSISDIVDLKENTKVRLIGWAEDREVTVDARLSAIRIGD